MALCEKSMWLALVAPNGCFIVFAAAILMSHPYTICEVGLQDYKPKYKHSKSTIHHLRDRHTKLCTKTSTYVLRTGSMDHPPKSSSLISILFSKLGKIGLKKMLGGVGFPHWTFFSPGASFSQWTFQ